MASPSEYPSGARSGTVTIAESGTVSSALQLGGATLIGIVMPAAITGATVSFLTSHDGTTYQALNNSSGTAVSVTVTASKNVSLGDQLQYLIGWEYIKVVSASAEAAARTLTLVADGTV